MPPEAFFSGPGLDRADLLRAQPERLAELAARPEARQLRWADGYPLLDGAGRLSWSRVDDPALFLGMDGATPCFSPLPHTQSGPAAFALLAQLDAGEAPLFACALSLANWHGLYRECNSSS